MIFAFLAPLWMAGADTTNNAPSATQAFVTEVRKTAETAIAAGDDDVQYQSLIGQINKFATSLRTASLTPSQVSETRATILELSKILNGARKAFDGVLDKKEERIRELSNNSPATTNANYNPKLADARARVVVTLTNDLAILKTIQIKMTDLDGLLKVKLAELK